MLLMEKDVEGSAQTAPEDAEPDGYNVLIGCALG